MPGPGDFAPSFGTCPQCGFSHPSIAGKCPMAKDKVEGVEIDLNPFLSKLRNILIANIQNKKIKDLNKLYSHVILTLQKTFDNYKE